VGGPVGYPLDRLAAAQRRPHGWSPQRPIAWRGGASYGACSTWMHTPCAAAIASPPSFYCRVFAGKARFEAACGRLVPTADRRSTTRVRSALSAIVVSEARKFCKVGTRSLECPCAAGHPEACAAGMWMKGFRSRPPASIRTTLVPGSSVNRLASTQPAEPAPTNDVIRLHDGVPPPRIRSIAAVCPPTTPPQSSSAPLASAWPSPGATRSSRRCAPPCIVRACRIRSSKAANALFEYHRRSLAHTLASCGACDDDAVCLCGPLNKGKRP
jgi:hypothetical protein